MNDRFPQLFWGLIAVMAGFIIMGVIVASGIIKAKRGNDTISVTGSARQTVKSDYATWGVSVWCLSADAPPYDCAKKRGQRIREFLNAHHVADSSITEGPIRVDQIFGQPSGAPMKRAERGGGTEFIGFKCSQRLEVHTSLVDSVDKLVRDVSELIPDLIEMSSEAPQYFYTKLSDMRVSLLAEATKDAKTRAEMIAGSTGGKIGAIRNARMGVVQVTAPNSRDVRDYGVYDITTIDKDITAVVTVSFAVE